MNVLAEEQKKLLDKSLSEEEYKKQEKEFLNLYYELREANDKKFYSNLTLEERRRIHKFILAIYKIKNRLEGYSYEVINDKRTPTNRPIIFAVTHVGKKDIEVISEAIKDHYYLLSGDFEHIQGIIDAPFLGMNGVFYFNEKVKEDRKAVSNKMIDLLKEGGNLMYFPEGTWNITPNLPMLPCYWGIVDIAKATNAIIVPVAACQYKKHFKINIGENFDMYYYGKTKEEKTRAITDLRDTLASLSWEIYETEKPLIRKELNGDEWDKYIKARFEEWPYFNEEYIKALENLIYELGFTFPSEEVIRCRKMVVNDGTGRKDI